MVLVIKSIFTSTVRTFCNNSGTIMKFLNVAEKNDAAKHISFYLSEGNSSRVSTIIFILI